MKIQHVAVLIIFLLVASFASAQVFEGQILQSNHDAEEKYNGSYITTSSSDLELVYDSWNDQGLQTIGLLFDNVNIPSNATITNAYIQFTADGSSSGDLDIYISGELINNSSEFNNSEYNISGRNHTQQEITWSTIPSWSDEADGTAQRTPNLSSIVSEIITSNGWESGHALTFIISGEGGEAARRKAYSFDESPTKAPKLIIEYSSNSNVDLALVEIVTPTDSDYPDDNAHVVVAITSFGNMTSSSYNVSYYLNGTLQATENGLEDIDLGETILFTFAETVDLSQLGSYDLTVELSITDDEEISNNSITKQVSIIQEVEPLLFSKGSSWRYWDSVSDPTAAWNTTDFVDTDWPVGVGHFGFGEGDENTKLTEGLVSYYFRKKVAIFDVNQLDEVYLHMVHDEAAIVYINGQEVMRTELMPLGNIDHTTAARQTMNTTIQNHFYTYGIDPSFFITGENTIAISVRNRSISDEDLSFDCFISYDYAYDQDGPYVSYVDDKIRVEEVTPTGLVSNTYDTTEGLEFTCLLPHMNTSFSFTLKEELTIEQSTYSNTPSKFLAISDFDGHIEGLTMVLRGEGVIDEHFNWTYGDGHLIISGDLFDRGFHITECMWLLYKLEDEALAQGGKLHLIIGNHEMFNLTDDWRYVEVKYFNNAHLMGKRMSQLYDSNTELGRWLRTKNIIEEIGGHLFVHGGISPTVAALNLNYDQINEYGRMEMNGVTCPNNACTLVNGSDGIYWYRGMVDEELSQSQVDNILDGYGVGRVIVGHTKANTIRSLYEDRVIAIDMYHVDNFEDGFMEALQFELGCFYLFHTDGQSQNYSLLNNCDQDVNNLLEVNGEGQIQIYPNPSSQYIHLEMTEKLTGSYDYLVLTMDGELVKQGRIDGKHASIEVQGLSPGKYVLTLQNADRVISGRFILSK